MILLTLKVKPLYLNALSVLVATFPKHWFSFSLLVSNLATAARKSFDISHFRNCNISRNKNINTPIACLQ